MPAFWHPYGVGPHPGDEPKPKWDDLTSTRDYQGYVPRNFVPAIPATTEELARRVEQEHARQAAMRREAAMSVEEARLRNRV